MDGFIVKVKLAQTFKNYYEFNYLQNTQILCRKHIGNIWNSMVTI